MLTRDADMVGPGEDTDENWIDNALSTEDVADPNNRPSLRNVCCVRQGDSRERAAVTKLGG